MTDTVVGVMVIGIEGPTALKCYGTAQEERKKSKFRPNEVKKASGRASQERNQLFMHNEPTHTHTHAHTYTHILNTQGKRATCDITCSVCVVCSHNVYFSYTGVYVYCDGFY